MSPRAGIQVHRRSLPFPWTPEKLPGLDLWLVAEDLVGAHASLVSSWPDRVLGSTFVQADDAKKPILVTTGSALINGKHTAHFDGVDDGMIWASNDRWPTAQTGHLFAVARVHTFGSSSIRTIFSTTNGLAAPNRYIIFRAPRDTFKMAIQQRNSDTADINYGDSIWAQEAVHLMEYASDGADYLMRLNNVQQVLTTSGGTNSGDWFADTTGRTLQGLGCYTANNDPANPFYGDIAELIIMNGNITPEDRAKLNNYVTQTYGLTLAA